MHYQKINLFSRSQSRESCVVSRIAHVSQYIIILCDSYSGVWKGMVMYLSLRIMLGRHLRYLVFTYVLSLHFTPEYETYIYNTSYRADWPHVGLPFHWHSSSKTWYDSTSLTCVIEIQFYDIREIRLQQRTLKIDTGICFSYCWR